MRRHSQELIYLMSKQLLMLRKRDFQTTGFTLINYERNVDTQKASDGLHTHTHWCIAFNVKIVP